MARNRVKRSLRAAFDTLSGEVGAGFDYVLVVRPGFGEVAEARGAGWVAEQVREVFRQAAGARADRP